MKKHTQLILIISLIIVGGLSLIITFVGQESPPTGPTDPIESGQVPPPPPPGQPPSSPEARTEATATYAIVMDSPWSRDTHPDYHPDGSHLSPMVAWSHRQPDAIFSSGDLASPGMEIMAETGGTSVLTREIEDHIGSGDVFNYSFDQGALFTPGSREIQVTASPEAGLITVVSMIAPSPDWFIAARNVELYKDGEWQQSVAIPARLYDAGTDNGETFNADDDDTNPKAPIAGIENGPDIPIATFRLEHLR